MKQDREEVDPPKRGAFGRIICPRCDGLGRLTAHSVACSRCNGSGEVKSDSTPQD